jgi:hypothetical protein
MPDILLAISKALASVPGLGPVFNPLISLREEEKATAANAALLQKLSQGSEISREALDEILAEVVGARQDNRLIREQVVTGFYAVLKLAVIGGRRQFVDGSELHNLLHGSAEEAEERVLALVQANTNLLSSQGLITQSVVRDELVRLYSDDVRTLLAVAQPAGFPKGWVPTNVAPIQAYYLFLETCEGLPSEQRARVARALARKMPGSAVLDKWAALWSSFPDTRES